MESARIRPCNALAFAIVLLAPLSMNAQSKAQSADIVASAATESQIQTDLAKSFSKDRFQHIRVRVDGGIVTLSGTTALYADKEDADKKARQTKNVIAVRNEIEAGGTRVSDLELQQTLVKKIEYDRVGYGTTAFNAISVAVSDGVVALAGHAYGPMDKDSAVSVASNTPGVRDVINDIEVDPVSLIDDQIRIATARAVYGSPSLFKYALDPGKPIRISVQNGHVTLYGVVGSKADRDLAYIRANGVPGVFRVRNQLQVEGEKETRE